MFSGFNLHSHIPLISDYIKPLLIYLLAIWMSFVMWLAKFFDHFYIGPSVFFILICKSSLYTLDTSSYRLYFADNQLCKSIQSSAWLLNLPNTLSHWQISPGEKRHPMFYASLLPTVLASQVLAAFVVLYAFKHMCLILCSTFRF